jgi:hypothetical protein
MVGFHKLVNNNKTNEGATQNLRILIGIEMLSHASLSDCYNKQCHLGSKMDF